MKVNLKDTHAFILILTGLVIGVVSIVIFLWGDANELSKTESIDTGKFGDYGSFISGVVGIVWSLASMLLFYVALVEQRKDFKNNQKALSLQTEALKHQIAEFEQQTNELRYTREVYAEQSLTQQMQRFESTFFQLITLHNNIAESFEKRKDKFSSEVVSKGRETFEAFTVAIRSKYEEKKSQNEEINPIRLYLLLYDQHQAHLSHYFRNLYHIYKFIDQSKIDDKKFYSGLVRAQLSAFELVSLFYNCLSSNGVEKFKPYIEKYSVFKNLDTDHIAGGKPILRSYSPNAYGHLDYSFLEKRG